MIRLWLEVGPQKVPPVVRVLIRFLLTHAVLGVLLGMMLLQMLYLAVSTVRPGGLVGWYVDSTLLLLCNGACVAYVDYLVQRAKHRAFGEVRTFIGDGVLGRRDRLLSLGVSFFWGAISGVLLFSEHGMLGLAIGAVIIGILHVGLFSRAMAEMLRAEHMVTWLDLQILLYIYVTMLACFTLFNVSLQILHDFINVAPAFSMPLSSKLIVDTFYFTVVMATTVGFGDISPQTWDAKLVVVLQCLTSYVMFGLIVGIALRGVRSGSVADRVDKKVDNEAS